MDSFNKLVTYFQEFPGIGPRQARRFVYFLLTRNPSFIEDFSANIKNLKSEVSRCSSCYRFFLKGNSKNGLCSICGDPNRDKSILMLVSRDADLEAIEKSHVYEGLYFVLGGSIPILDKNPEARIRSRELMETIESRALKVSTGTGENKLREIIFSLNANPEGENTKEFLERFLKPLKEKYQLTFSTLGRGLSTGTELEYSDSETIKNALRNKHSS